MQFKIDALRFKLKTKRNWKTHPCIEMLDLSNGKIRVLDTKEGKESLLIIPDGPNVIEHHFELVEALGKSYRVIIFDLYGFGFSTHDGSYDYSFDKTNVLINELLEILNIKRTNIVFPCANGFYGIAYANTYPERINQLILLQTPSLDYMDKWAQRTVPGYLKKPFLSQLVMPFVEKKFADKWYDYALPKGIDPDPYKSIAIQAIKNGGVFCLCSLTQGIATQNDNDFSLDNSLPVTLLYGAKDFTHKHTDFESIRAYHSKVDLISFEESGHFPHLEDKNRFIQIIKDKVKS